MRYARIRLKYELEKDEIQIDSPKAFASWNALVEINGRLWNR